MSEKLTCQRCGAALGADAPEGLCPRCLMGLNLTAPTEPPGELGPGGTKVLRPAPEPPPLVGDIAGHFPQLEIIECLGRGGMGVVYKARQPKLDRFVALKILAREKEGDPHFAERFQREARALARLNHPNIVAVHDFGETDGLFYLLMEFVDGANLRQLIRAGKMSPEQALAVVPPICEALQYAHQLGIVHRDIKPENILVDKQGRVKIADFGIAKMLGAEGPAEPLTGEQQAVGTPHYMAPEQLEKPQTVDHRADIFSLGVVFYEMLTGELPLGKFAPPSQKVHIDVRLDEVVLHALEKEPGRRYQQVGEVKTDLDTIARTPGRPAMPEPPRRHPTPPPAMGGNRAPRFSRTAMVSACWLAASMLAFPIGMFLLFWPRGPFSHSTRVGWEVIGAGGLLSLLCLTGPFGSTILGWVAVSQIRHSAGTLYGLWLAVLEGLFFPLLLLDGVLAFVWMLMFGLVQGYPVSQAVIPVSLLTAAMVDLLIIRRVWRAVNTGSAPVPPRPAPAGGRAWKVAAVIVAAIMLALAIPIAAVLLAIGFPAYARTRERARMQQQMSLEQERLQQDLARREAENAARAVPPPLEAEAVPADAVQRGSEAWQRGDYQSAFRLLLPVAIAGNPIAQHRLGVMYVEGDGVRQDYEEATRWFRKAADQGQGEAQFSMGLRYFEGQSVPRDDAQAARWFKLAADQGVGMAASMLAQLYAEGRGVPQDYREAYTWLSIAGTNIEPDRVTITLRELRRKLSAEQLTEAEGRVREFVPNRTGPADL